MSTCSITLSANAGVAIQLGDTRLWSDAMHRKKVPGFSTISAELMEKLETTPAFFDPDLILCSHLHVDHFSRTLMASAHALWPKARLILPEQVFPDQLLLEGREVTLFLAGLQLRFHRLPHDGEKYADVSNYGCILRSGDFRVLLAGDCAVASPELTAFVGDTPIDVALLNFPWLTLSRGREAIARQIRPKHLLLYHLPFQADDCYGYRAAAQKSLERLSGVPDVRLLMDPLQTETF